MASEYEYVRLTKICEIPGSNGAERRGAFPDVTREGSEDHRLGSGYVIDGWFLEQPRVGRPMILLRFRRNGFHRAGLFTSSLVTYVGEKEIRTENSTYQLEYHTLSIDPEKPGFSPRTIRHQKQNTVSHSSDNSERLVRVARVQHLARKIFGTDEAVACWLSAPAPALGGLVPVDLLDTDSGSRDVEAVLHGIAHGNVM